MANLGYVAITPSDTVSPGQVTAIWVGVSGDVAVKSTYDTTAVVLKAAPVGWLTLPHAVVFVMATGTAATNLIGALALSVRQTVGHFAAARPGRPVDADETPSPSEEPRSQTNE